MQEQFKETKEQEEERKFLNAQNLERVRAKQSRQEYEQITSKMASENSGLFSKELSYFKKQGVELQEDFKFVLTYGFGFISLMFLGFLSGYMLGKYALRLNEEYSLILSLIVGVSTIMLEVTLMLWRIYKADQMKERLQHERKLQIK